MNSFGGRHLLMAFIAGLLVARLASSWLPWPFGPSRSLPAAPEVIDVVRVVSDTVWRTVPVPQVRVRDLRGTIVIRDTVRHTVIDSSGRAVTAEAFEARGDTVAGRDTISVLYRFPESRFRFDVRRSLDSLPLVTTNREIVRTVYQEPGFWERAGMIGGGLMLGGITGYVLGSTR